MSGIYDFIVLGAGASGLFFAAAPPPGGAAVSGKFSVLLLERQERPGRKLLLSGGGKCNITNRSMRPENYLCGQPRFCAPALKAFTPERVLDFLRTHQIAWEEREYGQIFCRRGAEEVRDALLTGALRNGATLKTGQRVQLVRCLGGRLENTPANESGNGRSGWEFSSGGAGPEDLPEAPEGARYLAVSNGQTFFSRNLLVASGGKAWPRAGSTTFGHTLARAAGHRILPLRPGLTPLKMPRLWPLHGLQGISLTVKISIVPETPAAPYDAAGAPSFVLPLLFTHSGLSGPACLQISSYLPGAEVTEASEAGSGGHELELDFLPGLRLEELLDAPANGRSNLQSLLRKRLPERLADALLDGGGLGDLKTRKLAELSRASRQLAAMAVHQHRVRPEPPGFGQAESTVGGVDTGEINPKTMESLRSPGLYFAGEVLDVCGWLGGYNLHWAWASAWLARVGAAG